MDMYTFRGGGTNMPHELGTTAPPGTTSPAGVGSLAGAAGPAGVAAPGPCMSPVPITSFPVCTTWMNKIDQGNVGLIEWMKL
jgi:hypothetical protein